MKDLNVEDRFEMVDTRRFIIATFVLVSVRESGSDLKAINQISTGTWIYSRKGS